MPSPESIAEVCQKLRALLSRTNPQSEAHRELVEALRLLEDLRD